MKLIKRFFSALPAYVLWFMASALLWGWLVSMASDTARDKKIVLYADVPEISDVALSGELEKALPDGIRMVQVHPFSYAMFNDSDLLNADLYIVPESKIAEYAESFAPAEDFRLRAPEEEYPVINGTEPGQLVRGIRVHSQAEGTGCLSGYLTYRNEDGEEEDFYLLFGVNSTHLGRENDTDDAALAVAEKLLKMH